MPLPPVQVSMLSHAGQVRARNEDACAADVARGVFVVCDGMGGAAGGEVASTEAAQAFLAFIRQHGVSLPDEVLLSEAVQRANSLVYDHALREPKLRGMGTTLAALKVAADGSTVTVAHAGDSRCYRLRAGALVRLTEDHSLVAEQVRAGEISEAEARVSHLRNIITRVIGSQLDVQPEVKQLPASPGDVYLLCSDGLTRDLSDGELAGILLRQDGSQTVAQTVTQNGIPTGMPASSLERMARELVSAANHRGGGDNITVIVVELPA